MDRILALLSGTLFLVTAAAIWVFLPVWMTLLFVPALIWLGWLMIAEAIVTPVAMPRQLSTETAKDMAEQDSEPKDPRKLAA